MWTKLVNWLVIVSWLAMNGCMDGWARIFDAPLARLSRKPCGWVCIYMVPRLVASFPRPSASESGARHTWSLIIVGRFVAIFNFLKFVWSDQIYLFFTQRNLRFNVRMVRVAG